jgi:hypothetical protein
MRDKDWKAVVTFDIVCDDGDGREYTFKVTAKAVHERQRGPTYDCGGTPSSTDVDILTVQRKAISCMDTKLWRTVDEGVWGPWKNEIEDKAMEVAYELDAEPIGEEE